MTRAQLRLQAAVYVFFVVIGAVGPVLLVAAVASRLGGTR